MSEIGKILIEGLEDLLQKLQSGEPVEGTQVERVETPDGPMHIRKNVMLDGCKTEGEAPDVLQ